MEQKKFYVLESKIHPGYYSVDDQILTTQNIEAADHYDELELAQKLAGEEWTVKLVTVMYAVTDIE